jgi:hypothetical protein
MPLIKDSLSECPFSRSAKCFAIMNQPKIVCLVPEDLTRPQPIDNYDLSLYLQRRHRGIVPQ